MHLRYLHISDLHLIGQRKDKEGWAVEQFNQDMVTCSMTEAIKKLVQQEGKTFDLIFITGDLAMSGKPDDYEVVKVFCERLLNATGVPPARHFLVPGNHDVERDKVDHRNLKFGTEDEVTGILCSPEAFRALTLKFDAFNNFAEHAMGRCVYGDTSYYFVEAVSIPIDQETVLLNVVGLNSSLFAGYDGDDRQNLALGLPQMNGALNKLDKQARLTIVLFHHPFACFHAADKVCRNLLMQKADLILTGHLHEPENMCVSSGAGQAVFISAGACFENRESANSFNVVEIDLTTGAGKVQFYKYLPNYNSWKENTDANFRDRQGIFHFEIERIKPKDDVASIKTGLNLLRDLIGKEKEVADAVCLSKKEIETTYRQIERLKLFKTIHDELHKIEFDCLLAMQKGEPVFPPLPYTISFSNAVRRIREAIKELKMSDSVYRLQLDRLETVEDAFAKSVETPGVATYKEVVSALNKLLTLAPPEIDKRISDAAAELNLDDMVKLMKKVSGKLPAATAAHDAEIELFLKSIEALNKQQEELKRRVSEHGCLQDLDKELRAMCFQKAFPGDEEWMRIKTLRVRLGDPFSAELKAGNKVLDLLERKIEEAVERGQKQAARKDLGGYFIAVSYAFREVDSSLRDFCMRLSEVSQPLEAVLDQV